MYLLDANALIALFWPAHVHHCAVLEWFKRNRSAGWATCALTQAAFVRVVSQPAFHSPAVALADAASLLSRNLVATDHRFLPITSQLVDVLSHCTGGVVGHRQVTDAWLITIANLHGAKLVTFDQRMTTLLATEIERDRDLVVLKVPAN